MFEILKNFLTIPPAPKKKTMTNSQVEDELNVRASEPAPFFNFAKPKSDNCCKKVVGSTFNDYAFKFPVVEESFSESLNGGNKGKKAHFNNSLRENDLCPSNLDDNSADLLQKTFQNQILHFLLVQKANFLQNSVFPTISRVPKVASRLMFQKYLSIISASKPPSIMCGLPF